MRLMIRSSARTRWRWCVPQGKRQGDRSSDWSNQKERRAREQAEAAKKHEGSKEKPSSGMQEVQKEASSGPDAEGDPLR